ncbi:TetR/AcrR family transcriptional regulator [Agromyces sp. LHK192]|uniref:TetR/AcrR family transcriptional regulator n=1 Tax=Agromyces sp. LHK192 TaxID=2498704 RepID=UPI000FD994D0|nr:TetR/AcrR family transcriptional regulator [Agromyces sp. LHK192]
MSAVQAVPAAERRIRPKDRRQRIAMAAAEAFSERGYHQVGMGDVAAAVGISAPALYRHFPNKYALFVDAVDRLAHGLIEATDAAAEPREGEPASGWFDAVVVDLIEATIGNRRTGGLYRWEGRYLEPADRRRVRDDFALITDRVRRPLEALRLEEGRPVPDGDGDALAAAAMSAVASITSHHTKLPHRQLVDLLRDVARDVAETDLPPYAPAVPDDASGLPSASKRELIISEALVLFHRRGYHDTGIDEISAAVGLTASGFYRYFGSKSELLLEACVRAAERLSATTADALGGATSPEVGLHDLVDAYVAHSFTHHDLMSVYFSDAGALPPAEQERLRALQRRHVDEWVALLRAVRPELSPAAARFRVHAGLNIVVDIGRLVHFDATPSRRARVCALVRSALGVGANA